MRDCFCFREIFGVFHFGVFHFDVFHFDVFHFDVFLFDFFEHKFRSRLRPGLRNRHRLLHVLRRRHGQHGRVRHLCLGSSLRRHGKRRQFLLRNFRWTRTAFAAFTPRLAPHGFTARNTTALLASQKPGKPRLSLHTASRYLGTRGHQLVMPLLVLLDHLSGITEAEFPQHIPRQFLRGPVRFLLLFFL